MEGVFLTIALSIVIPLLILLLWIFVMFIVVKKCIFGKRRFSENGDTVSCRLEDCTVETSATSTRTDEPILIMDNQEPSSDTVNLQLQPRSSIAEPTVRLPLYSTLPRNSTRPFSRDCSRDLLTADSRHGYRLSPSNYSPFSRDTSLGRTQTMQALSMYCDRYIADARYDPPPPYNSREGTSEHTRLIRTVSGREVFDPRSTPYGSETWI